jgi:hypothetical protein
MRRRYEGISGYDALESLCNLIEGSEGVETGLVPRKPESESKSRQYLRCHREIPFVE